eukprot:3299140-Alexandrium_andersonii.AAC.1
MVCGGSAVTASIPSIALSACSTFARVSGLLLISRLAHRSAAQLSRKRCRNCLQMLPRPLIGATHRKPEN